MRARLIGVVVWIVLALLIGIVLWQRSASIDRTSEVVTHICVLQDTTYVVWAAAIASCQSLPNKTADQVALLAALRRGLREIELLDC